MGGWLLGWILRMEIWRYVMRGVVGTCSGLFFADGTVCINYCCLNWDVWIFQKFEIFVILATYE